MNAYDTHPYEDIAQEIDANLFDPLPEGEFEQEWLNLPEMEQSWFEALEIEPAWLDMPEVHQDRLDMPEIASEAPEYGIDERER